ncbi:PREDICTED: uncharacterized protein At1g76070-like [Fragaria vesca subsp. vesca]|uniref:uncharacterized protein At1g76070-like n=1 Tax=Fragaria vesca subsp. vesca TaxID=101020 RepID=UPI0002C30226|nr:PREDICTED: uncharacterized protein At1g76070-like [Fragaria vesca subsp. vesca]
MELQKQSKSRSKILKFLPKAASAVYFHGASYSPKHKPHGGRGVGFSGPLIPDEARRKPRNNVGGSSFGSVDEVEPTSPKVSCMGQIKKKKEQHQQIKKTKREGLPPRNQSKDSKETKPSREVKKHASTFRRMFSGVNSRRKSDADVDDLKTNKAAGLPDRAPSLSQMRRFASGRGKAIANFDWQAPLAKVAPRHDDDNNQNYHSDEDGEYSDHEDHEREHTKIAFSAPLTIGGSPGGDVALQPRKEINLWKRRTMAPPSPLQVKAQ